MLAAVGLTFLEYSGVPYVMIDCVARYDAAHSWQPADGTGANADAGWGFNRLVDAFIVVVFMFLFWRLERSCHCQCDDLQNARRRLW